MYMGSSVRVYFGVWREIGVFFYAKRDNTKRKVEKMIIK
jgi:hypothetical protein